MLKAAVAFASLFLLVSCGSDSGGTTGPGGGQDPSVPTSITVSPNTATLNALGATTQFSAVVRDQNGQIMGGASVSWASSNTSVLTVSSSGLGTAVAAGAATVTANSGAASGTASATVQQVPTQLQVSLPSDNVAPGSTMQGTVTVNDAGGNAIPSPTVTWSSSDPDLATVTAGLVTGVAPGLVYIKTTVGSLADSVQISVADGLQQEQMTIFTSASGKAAVFSVLGGGTHLQIEVEDGSGQVLQGATVEYGEDAEQVYMAVRKTGYAPAFVFGTVEELKDFGEEFTPPPEMVAAARSLSPSGPGRAIAEALRVRITLPDISSAQLSVIQNAFSIQTFFHKYGPVTMGSDGTLWGRKCMTWDAFVQLQIARLGSVPGWADAVVEMTRSADPTFFDPNPTPGGSDIYFSAQDVVNLLTGEDLLAEKANLLGAAVGDSPTGRRVEVEWDFGDSGPPVRKGLGSFKIHTNNAYCGGAIPAGIYPNPATVTGSPGSTVQGSVLLKSEWENVVPGVAVTFSLVSGHGTLSGGSLGAEVTTDGNGEAAVSWTLPGAVGSYTLTASAEGADGQPLTATITGTVEDSPPLPPPPSVPLATGNTHTCGLTESDGAQCWGRNGFGELGNGLTLTANGVAATKSTPYPVSAPVPFHVITAGAFHSCGLTDPGSEGAGGDVFCWGSNHNQKVGPGDPLTPVPIPTAVPGVPKLSSLVSGSLHNCGLSPSGQAYCWGANTLGQLGIGTISEGENVKPVATTVTFRTLAAGGYHTCGIEAGTNTVYCWGNNHRGQAGSSVGTDPVTTPMAINGGFSFVEVATGWYHTCGVTTEEQLLCWGNNDLGQLGWGAPDQQWNHTPAPVVAVSGFTSVTAGQYHTCGIAGTSTYCWGQGYYGALGDGGNLPRYYPVLVLGDHGFQAVRAGTNHTCGLTADGTAYCWGYNGDFQLGDGTDDSRNVPTMVNTSLKFDGPGSG